jgi:hypothetical protein
MVNTDRIEVEKLSNQDIVVRNEAFIEQGTQFEIMLKEWGLPSENIIASADERIRIVEFLPSLMSTIPEEQRSNATYLSRFVAGALIGLFDASLNYIWNEVVISLRKRIVHFGIDVFFDNAVSTKVRDQYLTEEDLSGIKDRVMLDTLIKLEWISKVVYLKLCHILDMRNQIGASHPNTYDINALELLGWLQTCVSEVIADKPSDSAVLIRGIIQGIKTSSESIDDNKIQSIDEAIAKLSSSMAGTLLRSLFGIFIADNTTLEVRNNILKLSKVVWKYCKEDVKVDFGEKKLLYRNSLQTVKEDLAYKFLENCDGLSYLSITERSLTISSLCDDLIQVHDSWDNYYHEVPLAREIMKYISLATDIPKDRETKIINTFLVCRIGREVSSGGGVAPGAVQFYDSLFKLLSEDQIKVTLVELNKYLDAISSGTSIRARNIRQIIDLLNREDINDRLKEILDYIVSFDDKNIIHKVYKDKKFKDISKGILIFN